jgi:hypothetical protein
MATHTAGRAAWLCAAMMSASLHAATPTASELVAQYQTEQAYDKLMKLGDEIVRVASLRDLSPLEPWLSHYDRHTRANAAYLFAKLGDPRGLDTLAGILDDFSYGRALHVSPGNCIHHPEQIETKEGFSAALNRCPAVFQRLIQEDRYYAVHMLGKLRDPRAVDVLIPLLDHDEVNYNVAWALGEIGDARAIPALIAALSNIDALVRVTSIGALVNLRATESLPDLIALYDDTALPSAGERMTVGATARKAVESLQRMGART